MVTGIMTASVTGAGLVIAFYALLATMSERIFERRIRKLEKKQEMTRELKDARAIDIPDRDIAYMGKKRPHVEQLTSLADEYDEFESFPRYLGPLVGFDFALFITTSFVAFYWLASDRPFQLGNLVGILFMFSIIVLGVYGVSGIAEVYATMRDSFEELKKQEKAVQALREAVKGPVEPPT